MADLAGQKQFSDLIAEVSDEVLDEDASTSTNPSLTAVKRYINNAYREILTKAEWWFKFAKYTPQTVIGTSVLTLDDTLGKIESVMIPKFNIRLAEITRERINADLPGAWTNVGNATPIAWVNAERASNNALQIELYPAPAEVYDMEIWGSKRFGNLTNDTDVPIIPPEWQDVLVNLAICKAMLKIGDPRAEDFKQLYQERYEEMWLQNEKSLSTIYAYRNADRDNTVSLFPGIYFPYAEE